ncbi:NAD-dependent succinate-semialdehyde dehydrogenase [Phenylobacterium montanum]|uniref:NAD-dependent succinate-semialdehyde dehydrogenase n=1 Tax=Phenylobacterium montanum TaxID=2823693 RepID=A0A975G488_9CAUL|nr:NAD-dependent succinate-semialdehyde dehydrogenase [Caulobacter sp. S6]QUD90292.1 NAD-dependent succinate-semialdehyde dehydrogenase [Caulobacter sp. S6]
MIELMHEACLVDGRWVTGEDWLEVDDPASGRIIGRVPNFGAEAARCAIEAARAAQPAWAATPAAERARVLRRLANLIEERVEELAALLTLEQGKPLAEARAEVRSAAAFFEWFAEEGRRAYGDIIPSPSRDRRLLVIKQAIGVVAAITPWNFPISMPARKVAPALAAGCAIVLKPAVQTPFSALALGALAQEAGLPAGLFSVVTGDPQAIGLELTTHPAVAKVSFTGSTATGAKIFTQSAGGIKRLGLELGGNAPFIVFADADLDAAVAGALESKFRNAGQTCVCANRFYVEAPVYDAFVERLATAAAALKAGPGQEADSRIGPLIDERAVAKVERLVAGAVEQGASLVVGGARDAAGPRFFQPTVLCDVSRDMAVVQEEIFGPVAPVLRFHTEAEAVALANDSPVGLAAYIYSRDVSRIWRVAEALETGMVGANTGLISTEAAPFGGVKASGLGREGSRYGLEDYLEIKYLCLAV